MRIPVKTATKVSTTPLVLSNKDAHASRWNYPGGEVGVRVEPQAWPDDPFPTYRIQSSDDFVALLMALDARFRTGLAMKEMAGLVIPYLPYARQDRVAVPGDPLAVTVIARCLAALGVKCVRSLDVHSEKACAQMTEAGILMSSVSPISYIRTYIEHLRMSGQVNDFVLVSPDKGAKEKTLGYMAQLAAIPGLRGTVVCKKVREPVTGRLTLSEVEDAVTVPGGLVGWVNQDVTPIIVDDICDGGRTFLNVAKALKDAGYSKTPHLWTTHAIYSAGVDALLGKFQTLGATDSFLSNPTVAGEPVDRYAETFNRVITVNLNPA